jgi:acetate kinase
MGTDDGNNSRGRMPRILTGKMPVPRRNNGMPLKDRPHKPEKLIRYLLSGICLPLLKSHLRMTIYLPPESGLTVPMGGHFPRRAASDAPNRLRAEKGQRMRVLVINAGSSSIKYQLFDMTDERVIIKGNVERIGEPMSRVTREVNGSKQSRDIACPDHSAAFRELISDVAGPQGVIKSVREIDAVGHRVVHGGEDFTDSTRITEAVLNVIRAWVPLAPLHNPPNLTGIEAAMQLLPDVPHVAVFDTAFHQSMPPHAFVYAMPYEYYKDDRIRRYGFHGTSHRYVSERAARMLKMSAETVRCITCHLGNGCSMAAVRGGKSIDTSMGLTPLEGLVMGTRSGDLDPAIIFHLADVKGLSLPEINSVLNKKSGLIGLSGVSNDMRTLDEAAADGNERARLAQEVFAYRVRKYIGQYLAVLNGADAIVFTGGIGENNAGMRQRCISGLEGLGIELDVEKNASSRGREQDVSTPGSRIRILVIPTNEELVIARDTARIGSHIA